MRFLEKCFPTSFKRIHSFKDFVIGIVIYAVWGVLCTLSIVFTSAICSLFAQSLPTISTFIREILYVCLALGEIYVFVGIVLLILAFLRIIR